jgi:hypothetical protein
MDVVEQRHVRRVVHPVEPATSRCASICSALAIPVSVSCTGLVLLVDQVIAGGFEPFAILGLDVALCNFTGRELRNDPIDLVVEVGGLFAGPEMISGVRASSIRMLSTSSTIAKWWPRCTKFARSNFMLSRR